MLWTVSPRYKKSGKKKANKASLCPRWDFLSLQEHHQVVCLIRDVTHIGFSFPSVILGQKFFAELFLTTTLNEGLTLTLARKRLPRLTPRTATGLHATAMTSLPSDRPGVDSQRDRARKPGHAPPRKGLLSSASLTSSHT